MKTQIVIQYSDDGLFGDGDPVAEDINVQASHTRFEEMVEAAVKSVFTDADIEFEYGINDSHSVDSRQDSDDAAAVGDIMHEVWNGWAWVVQN